MSSDCMDRDVHHPDHYTFSNIEVIDAIKDWSLNFCLGNVVKYVARAGKKAQADELSDLRKARFYLSEEIATIEKLQSKDPEYREHRMWVCPSCWSTWVQGHSQPKLGVVPDLMKSPDGPTTSLEEESTWYCPKCEVTVKELQALAPLWERR